MDPQQKALKARAWETYGIALGFEPILEEKALFFPGGLEWPDLGLVEFGVLVAGSVEAAERMLAEIVAGRVEKAG